MALRSCVKIGFFAIFGQSTTLISFISISNNSPTTAYFLRKMREINKNRI